MDTKYKIIIILIVIVVVSAVLFLTLGQDGSSNPDDKNSTTNQNPLDTDSGSDKNILTPPDTGDVIVEVDKQGFRVIDMGEAERIIVFNGAEQREVFTPGEYEWRSPIDPPTRYTVSAVIDEERVDVEEGDINP